MSRSPTSAVGLFIFSRINFLRLRDDAGVTRAVARALSLFLTSGRRFAAITTAPSPTPTAQNLGDALWGQTKRLRQLRRRFAVGVSRSYLLVTFALGWRVIRKRRKRPSLTNIHEQHPVVDHVRKTV
jgi:hypothetical protein